jgi:LytS/YehU family sensor histidine kinase
LEKELRILEFYLNIIKVRFSDHLKISTEIDESLLSKLVPALLLQPILENSIKHGYDFNHTDLEILVKIYAEGKTLIIRVENNGAPVEAGHKLLLKRGMGLANINDRLENLYGNNYFFEVRNKNTGSGVETVIKIPIEN